LKKLAYLGGAAGIGVVAILGIHHSNAADHADAPSLVPVPNVQAGNPMADLNDVYTWMTTDGSKVNLALTVSPFDNLAAAANMTRHFGPTVLYAFHLTSHPDMGATHGFGVAGKESTIICKFADDEHGECWLKDSTNKVIDYVGGDLSGPNGRISASQKFRVFAGRRSDPFFFNLGGAKAVIEQAEVVCGGGTTPGRCTPTALSDNAGCFKVPGGGATANNLRVEIGTKLTANRADTPCNDTTDIDCFKSANVMAIVVQIDKDEIVDGTDKLLSVWASTHAGS